MMSVIVRLVRILLGPALVAGTLLVVGPAPAASGLVKTCSAATPAASRPAAAQRRHRIVREAAAEPADREGDTADWTGKTQEEVVEHVVSKSQAGDSVLMHLHWNGFSTAALAAMQSGLADRGLAVCRNKGATAVRPTVNC
jgi:hypothetical protein